jgi:hypothetical protein
MLRRPALDTLMEQLSKELAMIEDGPWHRGLEGQDGLIG